jgi:uncharacterized protein
MTSMDWIVAALALLLTGLSKAGFGGGAGVLATPLLAAVFPPRDAVGILLPLLIVSDAIAVWHYWRDVRWGVLAYLWPGVLAGIGAGVMMFATVSDRDLKVMIGAVCVLFCLLQWWRKVILRIEEGWGPNWLWGSATGLAAGFTSTLAHAAGPVMVMYFVPQHLTPAVYVGSNSVFFAALNLLKVPPYVHQGLINGRTLWFSLLGVPAVVLGSLAGIWLNRRFDSDRFGAVMYALLFLTGLELLGARTALMGLWGAVNSHP